MKDNNFRDSTLDELYGASKFTEPLAPGKIDWKPIIIHATLTAVIVGIPIVVALTIQQRHIHQKMEAMRSEYKERLERLVAQQGLQNEPSIENT